MGAPRSQGTAAASALAGCSHCVRKKKSRGQAGSPSRQAHLASGEEVGGESSSCSLPGPGDAQPPPERTPVSPCHPTLRCSSLPCPTGSCHQHRKPLGRSGRFPHSPLCIHSMFSPMVARSLAGGLGSAGIPSGPLCLLMPQFPHLRTEHHGGTCRRDEHRGPGRSTRCKGEARGSYYDVSGREPGRNNPQGSPAAGGGQGGEGPPGSLFTPFCFSAASTFAKTGLLTFTGEARPVCGREPGVRAAAAAGGWARPGRWWGDGSKHRRRLSVRTSLVCVLAPQPAGRCLPVVDSGGCLSGRRLRVCLGLFTNVNTSICLEEIPEPIWSVALCLSFPVCALRILLFTSQDDKRSCLQSM